MGKRELTYGGLFEGIGMFAYAAQKAGYQLTWSNEIDPWCCRILNQNFNHKIIQEDVRKLSTETLQPIDVVCGGFPCQDISGAGLGKGIYGSRSGLWDEYYRIIKDTNPKYIVIENSSQLLTKGFEKIIHDLSQIGYDCEWECISASDYGCDHVRERLWVVAYPTSQRRRGILHLLKRSLVEKSKKTNALDTQSNPFLRFAERHSKPAVFGMDDENANRLDVVKRLGAVGNAIVWEIAYDILELIKSIENE